MIYGGRLGDKLFRIEVTTLPEVNGNVRLEVKLQQGDTEESYQFELLGRNKGRWTLDFDRKVHDFVITPTDGKTLVDWRGRVFPVEIYDLKEKALRLAKDLEPRGKAVVRAQMPGKVIEFLKQQGEVVQAGEGVVIVEAMKMQNEVRAPKTGKVSGCSLQPGESVTIGDVMFVIE